MPSPSNRVAFSIMNVDIMWYGLIITIAIGLAVFLAYKRADRFGIIPEKVLDYSIFCIPAGLIGARLYYILFNLDYYSKNLSDIVNIRGGGLAIHGALILGFLTAFVLSRIWKINTLNALDLGAPSIVIAQAIGRWGNFFNQEAHGGATDLPWGILVGGIRVHPTFLYESLWCLAVFVVLLIVSKRRKFNGQIFLLYCILYSFERFFVEQLRTDSLMLFNIFRQAQVLSAIVFVVGLVAYFYLSRNDNTRARSSTASSQESGVRSQNKTLDTNAANGFGEKDSQKNKLIEDNTIVRPPVVGSQESDDGASDSENRIAD